VLAVVCAGALAGCGGGGHDESLGVRWARAVDAERWAEACATMASPPHCAADLRRDYGGRRVRLLPAGASQQGDKITDNRTRFAVAADGRGGHSETNYEIRRRDGRQVVVLLVSVLS
jgi:hypothetical protein